MESTDKPEGMSEAERGRRKPRIGLSGKLLLLTIVFVMVAEIMIYVPLVANFRLNWLNDRLAAAHTAALVLDAAPQYIIPAKASFVADVAQFTPKTVETADERQKLMFRIKARIAPELLKRYIRQVKTGLPGMAYVRLDPNAPWPASLDGKVLQ